MFIEALKDTLYAYPLPKGLLLVKHRMYGFTVYLQTGSAMNSVLNHSFLVPDSCCLPLRDPQSLLTERILTQGTQTTVMSFEKMINIRILPWMEACCRGDFGLVSTFCLLCFCTFFASIWSGFVVHGIDCF